MRIGYVVLYVDDSEACARFWTDQVGMKVQMQSRALDFSIFRVGFSERDAALELVPRELMKENPDGLDLTTPSICFYVDDLQEAHKKLSENNVLVTEITNHFDNENFAFSDNEGRWFAVLQG
jgi:lactoylglutathione lyase